MTISPELLDAYRWQRQQRTLAGGSASACLAGARLDVNGGRRRYPASRQENGRPWPAVTWQAESVGNLPFPQYSRRIAHVENVERAGLRLVGRVMAETRHGEIWNTRGDESGWYTDPYGDASRDGTGLCWGVVYQLPARGGKARFVVGYQMGGTDAGPTLDMSGIYESDANEGNDRYGSDARDFDAARDAAYAADSMAQSAAEEERYYQAAWGAGSRWADRRERIAGEKAQLRALLIERRAARQLWRAGAHLSSICGAVADKARALLDDMAESRAEMEKLSSGDVEPLYFFPSPELRAAFNEGAGLQVLK